MLETHKAFREKLAELSREELLEIIATQNPDYIEQINRIEFVFRHLLSHLTDDQGLPIVERDFTNNELINLIDPPFIYSTDMGKMGFNEEAQRQIHIASDPVLWARTFLPVDYAPRVYQTLVLREPNNQRVLRLGRRMGKTFTLALLAMWYAYTHHEGKVLVIVPMKAHGEVIFDEILKLIDESREVSTILADSIENSKQSPQFEIEFKNKSTIKFFTTGMKSNSKTNVARGQEADVIILDEMDYMGPEDLVAIYAMLQTTTKKKKGDKKLLIGASTPSGLRETFWEWNTQSKHGFARFYFPSYANPMWDAEEEKQMRLRYPNPTKYRQEVEADWGEAAEGVYPRRAVDGAFAGDWEYVLSEFEYEPESHYVMGVDWDKYGAGVNICILEICGQGHEDELLAGRTRLVWREEVEKGDFTYMASIERIKFLDSIFNLEWIYVDRGAGETQLELLHKYGMDHPETGFQHKVKGFQFRENIEVRDPFTLMPTKKDLKSFMVDNLYRMLENNKLVFSEEDDEMYFQLISYIVVRTSSYGTPVFGAGGGAVDHAHDALILACLAVAQNYDEFLQTKYASRARIISSEPFLRLFDVENETDRELIEDKYGDEANAPVLRQRASLGRRRRMRPRGNQIQRRMIR